MCPQKSTATCVAALFADVDDVAELRRIAAYYLDLATVNGAKLLRAQTVASQNRQELDQKTRGFSLLARLSSDISAAEEPCFMARILTGHVNSMLHMNRSVVLLRDPVGDRFSILGSAGYADGDLERFATLKMFLPWDVTYGRKTHSTLAPLSEEASHVFASLDIRYFMAVPVISDDEVRAVIVTGRMREQMPFMPPLNSADVETVLAICGFFGAYLSRHRLVLRDRERFNDVERLVTERTAEIERQRVLLDASVQQLRETQRQLIMREKLASLGQLMAGIAHEIQNPLNFVNNFSDLSCELATEIEEVVSSHMIENDSDVDELFVLLRSNLEKISMHGKRADSIVRNMLQHSRGDGGGPELVELNAVLIESIEFASHHAKVEYPDLWVSITHDLDPLVGKLLLTSQEISRVFLNILSNGFYSLNERSRRGGSDFAPAMHISSRRFEGMVEVRLRDNGIGIPQEITQHIFTPFFSTKPSGEGSGLGLSLSYDVIVDGHGGEMSVVSRENEFTEFIIRLPT